MMVKYYKSPLGILMIEATKKGVSGLAFVESEDSKEDSSENIHLEKAVYQLKEFFEGKRKDFDLTYDLKGTEFQRSVWQALLTIPAGKTCSYKEIALKINNPKAFRAVGNANGKNPVPIFIPCHRVLAVNGFGGYTCGVWRKEWLLNHEGAL